MEELYHYLAPSLSQPILKVLVHLTKLLVDFQLLNFISPEKNWSYWKVLLFIGYEQMGSKPINK